MSALVMAAVLSGCASKEATDSSDSAADDEAALIAEVEAAFAGYQSWAQVDTWLGVVASSSPHGAYSQIWWDDGAYATWEAQAGGSMPVGATVVKESYNEEAGGDVLNLTVMHKVSESYGWFWGTWSTEGEVLLSGHVEYCTDCHITGQDYVMVVSW